MPKVSESFDLSSYALVADRIALFYERFPDGRIITHLVSRDRDIVFKAGVFRSAADPHPAATGWASEREGDGEINLVACLENTETSAIGRALANLGFTASRKRPSREEMAKAERARNRTRADGRTFPMRVAEPSGPREVGPEGAPPSSSPSTIEAPVGEASRDVLLLIRESEERGIPHSVLDSFRRRLSDGTVSEEGLRNIERQLRHWLLHGFSAGSVNS